MSQHGGTVLMGTGVPPLPKNIVSAISQIQQYYTIEKDGAIIPKDFLTLEGALDYWNIGFKTAFKNGFLVTVLAPLMTSVFLKYVPIFGTFTPTLYDYIWSVIISYSLTIGYALILAYVARYYIGDITRSAIRNLFGGIISGTIFSTLLIVIAYNFLYFFILTEPKVAGFLMSMKDWVGIPTLQRWYTWIMGIRKALLSASLAVVINAIILLSVPVVFMLTKARRVSKEIDNREKWQIGV